MIHRGKLMKILQSYGIPSSIVKAIEIMYTDTTANVLSPDGETAPFRIEAGVLQGDTLAPYLFIITLDYALRRALDGKEEELGFHIKKRQSRRIGPTCLTDLDFADDIALISEQLDQAQQVLERVENEAAGVGLMANAKKTKVMAFNQTIEPRIQTSDGSILEVVDDFTYLGSLVSSSKSDIKRRIALAWAAANKLHKIWKSGLSRTFKTRLFCSTVESVLLYGCETWTLTYDLQKKLDGCYTKLLRSILGYSWKDHIRNEELYGNLPKLSAKIRQRRLKLAGHCKRHPEEKAHDLVLWIPNHGKRTRGKPAMSFVRQLEDDTELKIEEVESLMKDRSTWRMMTGRGITTST